MSTISVNAVTDANGGNTATINSMTPTADSLQGFRNRIINGDMRIDQRNAGASVSKPASSYVLDRWLCNVQTPTTATVSRSTIAPAGFTNSLLVNVTTGGSISSIANYIVQVIEGFNTADLGFGSAAASTVTISFWVRSSVTGTFGGSLRNYALSPATTSRAYPFTYAINTANTWEYKTVTIAGDGTGGAGQWNTENQGSFSVFFDLGSGSLTGTAGAWAGSNLVGATGTQTGLMTTNGATWYVTGVQLEVGSVATPFERRPYGQELSLCQRYYYLFVLGSNFPVVTSANYGSSDSRGVLTFPTTMRGTPTVVSSSGTNHFAFFSNGASSQCNSLTADVLSANSAELRNNTSISVTTGYASWLRTSNASASLAFSAEL